VLTSHIDSVTSVAWIKDGKLASGSENGMVKILPVDLTGTLESQTTLSGYRFVTPFLSLSLIALLHCSTIPTVQSPLFFEVEIAVLHTLSWSNGRSKVIPHCFPTVTSLWSKGLGLPWSI